MLTVPNRWVYGMCTAALLLYASCQRFNVDDLAPRTPTLAFPLFNTTLTLKDLAAGIVRSDVQGDTLLTNADGSMTLSYAGDVASKPATDVFRFLQSGLIPVSDTVFTATLQAPDSVAIRRATLKNGTFSVIISNPFRDTLRGTFRFPDLTTNGQPFVLNVVIPPNITRGGSPWNSGVISMIDRTLSTRNNRITLGYALFLPNGQRVKVPDLLPGIAGVGLSFSNLEFSYIEGYWGYNSYPLIRDTIGIDINQTNLDGSVRIANPVVTMRVVNSWGIPTRGVIKYLSFISKDGRELPLNSTLFRDGYIDFGYPSLAAGEVGRSKTTTLRFDRSNSNIEAIFNSQPVQLIYELDAIANVQRDPSLIGFLTDKSNISLNVQVDLTLEGSVKNFQATQDLDVNFGEAATANLDNVESAEFKLVTENEMPVATALQLYFFDTRGSVIVDSLFAPPAPRIVAAAAPVNAAGIATGKQRTETLIPMSPARFDRIRESRKIRLKTAFTTSGEGNQTVRLLADQKTILKMGLLLKQRFQ